MKPNKEKPDLREMGHKDPDGTHLEAWEQTLEDMEAIEEDRRADGWDVVTLWSEHTDAVTPSMEKDYFGLVHIIPDNFADRFTETYDSDEFTEYLAYGTEIEAFKYLVTEFIDPENERSILLAARYNKVLAGGLAQAAEEEGALYSHLKTIDGTIIGSYEHEEWDPLLPQSPV